MHAPSVSLPVTPFGVGPQGRQVKGETTVPLSPHADSAPKTKTAALPGGRSVFDGRAPIRERRAG